MQGREGQVAGISQLYRYFGCFPVAHLTHHDDIGVVAEYRPNRLVEVKLVPYLELSRSVNDIFHRILYRQDVLLRCDHMIESCEQSRALTTTGRACNDNQSLWLCNCLFEVLTRFWQEAEFIDIIDNISIVEDSDNDTLIVAVMFFGNEWQNRDPETDRMSLYLSLNKAVLCFVNLETVHVTGTILYNREKSLGIDPLSPFP